MPPDPTVFVIDDDQAMRRSMKWLVESVGLQAEVFESAAGFLEAYDPQRPGCVVIDVRMPNMGGLELQERLAQLGCSLPVIVMTAFGDVPTAVKAMKHGALDFVEKPFNDQQMLDTINNAIASNLETRRLQASRQAVETTLERLTPREKEVLRLVVLGMSNKHVARQLGIVPKTVEAHRAQVMEKMQADSLADLVRKVALVERSEGYPDIR